MFQKLSEYYVNTKYSWSINYQQMHFNKSFLVLTHLRYNNTTHRLSEMLSMLEINQHQMLYFQFCVSHYNMDTQR